MNIFQSLLLGIIQGLTEFLPISSSAHLVLTPYLLGWQIPEDQTFIFDVLVQLGTLAAVILYFWRDLWRIMRAWVGGLLSQKPFTTQDSRLGWYLILATIPAGLLGVLIKDTVEAAFNSPAATAGFLLLTAALLALAERLGKRRRPYDDFKAGDALWMGIGQAVSILPGVSRSGTTMTAGMLRDLERPAAARFSFLMSIPVMLAAGLIAGLDLLEMPNVGEFLPVVLVGMAAAGVVGFLSIHWLLRFLTRRPLTVFSVYCVILALVTFAISALR